MTPDKVRKIAPEFQNSTDEDLQCFLDMAVEQNSPEAWGKVFGTAMAYLAAHLKALSTWGDPEAEGAPTWAGSGAVAPLVNITEGRWTMGLGTGLTGSEAGLDAGIDGELLLTRFGKRYIALRKSRLAGRSRLIKA